MARARSTQLTTQTPEQQQLLSGLAGGLQGPQQQMLQYLMQILSGDDKAFADFEAPFMRQFEEETIPGIAERFAGAGAQSSSGFQQALGSAGAGLSENLASLRGQLKSDAMGQLQGLLQTGLGAKSFENIYQPETGGIWGGLAQGAGQGGMQALMQILMGMA